MTGDRDEPPPMPQPPADPERFFDAFPALVDTSETGPWTERLNARYAALIHHNRELMVGSRVLDLASHDGRFAFAALVNGAAHVVGVDHKAHLIEAGVGHMRRHGIGPDSYTFVVSDLFDDLSAHGPFDVVFCFGILYHLNDHMRLLNAIADLEPRAVIVDTNVSQLDGAVVEVRSALGQSPPPPGGPIEGYPTTGALDAMLQSFGWELEHFDWSRSGLTTTDHMADYRDGRRVSVVASCPEYGTDPTVRAKAVAAVRRRRENLETQAIVVAAIADRHDLPAAALRRWVERADRRGG